MDDFFLLRFGAVDLIVVFVCVAADDDDAHADERYILLIETKNRRKRNTI